MLTHGPWEFLRTCYSAWAQHCPLNLSPTQCTKTIHRSRENHNSSLHADRKGTTHQIHCKYFTMLFLHLAIHHPLSFPPLPYHPVRSRRWFFGRSYTAHCSQASPPSLHHLVRRCCYFPCSSIIQAFARTHACLHARALKPLCTHTEKCWCTESRCRSSHLQCWSKQAALHQVNVMWSYAMLFSF